MQVKVNTEKPFMVVLVALVAVAWLALWVWGQSPFGRFLSHEHTGGITLDDSPVQVAVLVAGWTLMTTAMMLPTSLPLIMLFQRLIAQRRDWLRLVALLVMGYLAVWALFGFVAHLGDGFIHQAVDQIAWLASNNWLIVSATLLLAGIYQFTPLKYHCLDKCRSPLSFVMGHWQGGQRAARQALMLGVHHGLFCIGCCWSLMLLMFAVGMGNIGWMLVLGGIMAVEKNMPWGRRISMPLGVFLIGLSIMVGWGSMTGVFEAPVHSHS